MDRYICPSFFLENKLIEANSNVYKGKTIAIHNFIDLKDKINVNKEEYVLYFGRIAEEKGFKTFIETCKKLPNIKFKVAGTGPLSELCDEVKNVEFVGFKIGKDLEELIAKAQFSVYPSIWYENCPLSILESESLGTPVITAKYGGMMELVENNITGLLIDEINVENLKNAIESLYNDRNKIQEMSKNCIDKRENMITLENYCNEIMKIYQSVIDEKANR